MVGCRGVGLRAISSRLFWPAPNIIRSGFTRHNEKRKCSHPNSDDGNGHGNHEGDENKMMMMMMMVRIFADAVVVMMMGLLLHWCYPKIPDNMFGFIVMCTT